MGGLSLGLRRIADQLIADLLLLFGPVLGVAAGEEEAVAGIDHLLVEAPPRFTLTLGADNLCRVLVSPGESLAELRRAQGAGVYLFLVLVDHRGAPFFGWFRRVLTHRSLAAGGTAFGIPPRACAAALWSRLPIASSPPEMGSVAAAPRARESAAAVLPPGRRGPRLRGVRALPCWVGLPSFFSWPLGSQASSLSPPLSASLVLFYSPLEGLQPLD